MTQYGTDAWWQLTAADGQRRPSTRSNCNRVLVDLRFGEHTIRSFRATRDQAAAYEDFVRREFWGLTVETSPLLPSEAYEPLPEPLPEPRWWLQVPV